MVLYLYFLNDFLIHFYSCKGDRNLVLDNPLSNVNSDDQEMKTIMDFHKRHIVRLFLKLYILDLNAVLIHEYVLKQLLKKQGQNNYH